MLSCLSAGNGPPFSHLCTPRQRSDTAELPQGQGWSKFMSGIGWPRQGDGRAAALELCGWSQRQPQMGQMYGQSVKTPCGRADTLHQLSWRNWLKPLLKKQFSFLEYKVNTQVKERFQQLPYKGKKSKEAKVPLPSPQHIPPPSSIFCRHNRILK